jgi:hypothetical protein
MPRSHERSHNERKKHMSNMILQCKDSGDFKPHPEGIHPAVCVDVMDLGLVETEFQGVKKIVEKVKITFESEAKTEDGKPCSVFRSFSASLHPKSNLAAFLGKWRGRPVAPGESIDLQKLIGASCTLVISHQKNLAGKTYASIDAVSKPTRKVMPSGTYDPAAARQRYAEWKAKQGGDRRGAWDESRPGNVAGGMVAAPPANAFSKSPAPEPEPEQPEYDPEVGF